MDASHGGGRDSRGRGNNFNLHWNALRQRPDTSRSRLHRDCRLARGDPGQLIAGGCNLHGSAHREALVPGKNPLLLQFAGTPELRVLSPWWPNDLCRASAGGAPDLRRAEAPHFSVRVPGTVIISEVGRQFSLAEATAVQHGNMES